MLFPTFAHSLCKQYDIQTKLWDILRKLEAKIRKPNEKWYNKSLDQWFNI